MFTREEASRTRQEFWTVFGKYMNPIPSAEGLKINWINYRTGVKDVHFRLDAWPQSAVISISLEHSDTVLQELYYQRFVDLKSMLRKTVGEAWKWQLHVNIEGKVVSRIYKELPAVSILNKNQWPELISFFKPRIIALDAFWENARYSIEG